MLPNDLRPLTFATGIVRLLEMLPSAQAVAVAHRYEFLNDQRPDAFVAFGPPLVVRGTSEGKAMVPGLQNALTTLLDGLKASIVRGQHEGFETLLRGRRSTNENWDRARLLAGVS
jgi:hypothetical protein